MNSILEAAKIVLERRDSPIKCQELTKRIISEGLWVPEGKTPNASVGAAIYSEIKDNGDNSVFIKVAPGEFGLRKKHLDFLKSGKSYKEYKKAKKIKKIKKIKEAEEKNKASEATEEVDTTEESDEAEATEAPKDSKKSKSITQPGINKNSLTFSSATQKVLETFADKEPMHYKDITEKALQNKWLDTSSKTPESSLYSVVINEIRSKMQKGEVPRFVKHGRGYIGLSKWVTSDPASQIQENNKKVRKKLHSHVLSMSPKEFEDLVSMLLVDLGFEDVEVTKMSGDGGVDVRGTLVVAGTIRITMAVQAKKWQLGSNVQRPIVQQLRGSLRAHERGLIITTSDFSPKAVKEAFESDKVPIYLMNGEELTAILMEHEIGATQKTYKLFEMDFDSIFPKKPK